MSSTTDCREMRIVAKIQDKEHRTQAFDMIIDEYSERLYWHIRRIVVVHEDAEDVLQETFLRAFDKIDGYRGEGSLGGWLYRIATNLSIRALRKRRVGLFSSIDSVGQQLVSDLDCEVSETADQTVVRLQRAILELPVKQRLVFNMRYYDELPFDEISRITGQSVATLKTNYHYAAEKIKRKIMEVEL